MLYRSTRPAAVPTRPKLPQQLMATAVTGASGAASAPLSRLRRGRSTCSPSDRWLSRHVYAAVSPSCAVITLHQSLSRSCMHIHTLSLQVPQWRVRPRKLDISQFFLFPAADPRQQLWMENLFPQPRIPQPRPKPISRRQMKRCVSPGICTCSACSEPFIEVHAALPTAKSMKQGEPPGMDYTSESGARC